VQLSGLAPAVRNTSEEDIQELRWWPIAELRTSREIVFPERLLAALAAAKLTK
jgi:hypothetical protein